MQKNILSKMPPNTATLMIGLRSAFFTFDLARRYAELPRRLVGQDTDSGALGAHAGNVSLAIF